VGQHCLSAYFWRQPFLARDGYGVWDEANQCLVASLVEAIRDSGITHLRYPGGIEGDYFHWNEAIGKNPNPADRSFFHGFGRPAP
jgi:hypothetical protein